MFRKLICTHSSCHSFHGKIIHGDSNRLLDQVGDVEKMGRDDVRKVCACKHAFVSSHWTPLRLASKARVSESRAESRLEPLCLRGDVQEDETDRETGVG